MKDSKPQNIPLDVQIVRTALAKWVHQNGYPETLAALDRLVEQKEADALAWDRAVRDLSTQVVGLREALEFYAARHRYHSECCGNCINSDGGATARAALSNPAKSPDS